MAASVLRLELAREVYLFFSFLLNSFLFFFFSLLEKQPSFSRTIDGFHSDVI